MEHLRRGRKDERDCRWRVAEGETATESDSTTVREAGESHQREEVGPDRGEHLGRHANPLVTRIVTERDCTYLEETASICREKNAIEDKIR